MIPAVFPTVGRSAPRGTVTLSGEAVSAAGPSADQTAGLRFNQDGTVDRNINGAYTQIDSGTDWIIPNGLAAATTYWVRVQSTPPGDGFTTQPVASGTWIELTGASGGDREWTVVDTSTSPATDVDTGNYTMEISDNGGSTVLDSATYSLFANRTG